MAQELVTHIGLWSVQWFAGMADVLRGVEDTEREPGQEVARREQSRDRAKGESCAILQEVRNILQLWNVILAVSTVVDEQREDVVVLSTRMGCVEFGQVSENDTPGLDFCLSVLHVRQWLSVTVVVGQVSKVFASCTVRGVSKSRMVRVQFAAIRKDLIGESIQLADTPREPWNSG